MSFLSSSISSSSLSTPTGSTSPLLFHSVYPSFLPLHGIHSLYAAILKTPIVLHTIEEIPLFHEDSISHELVHLFHGITRAQSSQCFPPKLFTPPFIRSSFLSPKQNMTVIWNVSNTPPCPYHDLHPLLDLSHLLSLLDYLLLLPR